jgi:hypothetical protein
MLYMFLICSDPNAPEAFDPDVQRRHAELEQSLRERGVFAGGAGLMPAGMAKTVRLHDGAPVVTDGPFAETKEAVGGYYVIDCKDESEALEYATKIPVKENAWVQVRQVALWHPK